MSYPYRFYAIVIPGLEQVAAKELEQLSAHEIKPDSGGVHFSGTMETMFRVNLRSRTITRLLMRLKRFTAMTLSELSYEVEKVDLGQFLNGESNVEVHASCHKSKLMHTTKIEHEILQLLRKRGLCGAALCGAEQTSTQQIFIRIENNRCVVSIDTSGERLDRRGYRLESGKAPVRETLAAAVLQWSGWQPDEPLLVPMCGSGTFAIEAAMMASKRASGLTHLFPFLNWPSLKQKAWKRLYEKTEAMAVQATDPVPIYASDIHASAVAITKRNAERGGVMGLIHVEQADVRTLKVPESNKPGIVVCNPPYGQRIDADVRALYASLGQISRELNGWRMVVFSPNKSCERALGIPVRDRLRVKHGGGWAEVLCL